MRISGKAALIFFSSSAMPASERYLYQSSSVLFLWETQKKPISRLNLPHWYPRSLMMSFCPQIFDSFFSRLIVSGEVNSFQVSVAHLDFFFMIFLLQKTVPFSFRIYDSVEKRQYFSCFFVLSTCSLQGSMPFSKDIHKETKNCIQKSKA